VPDDEIMVVFTVERMRQIGFPGLRVLDCQSRLTATTGSALSRHERLPQSRADRPHDLRSIDSVHLISWVLQGLQPYRTAAVRAFSLTTLVT